MSEPAPSASSLRWLAGLAVVAIVLFLPLRAAPGESPWPAALGFAAFGTLVGLGGWWVLRQPPPEG